MDLPRPLRVRRLVAVVTLTGVALVGASGVPTATAAPAERLPDLRMELPADLRLERTDGGRRLLRLTTTILNVGDGPFELRATRESTTENRMTVRQRIRRSDGSWVGRATDAVGRYATDGHGHWHIQRVAGMDLFTGKGAAIREGRKVGFCFFDTGRYRPGLPGSPRRAQYGESGCGTRSSRRVTMGISVGWGDRYQASLAYQWIDVTGVPAGTYHVRVMADPLGQYRELREANNCAWARIRIPASGSRVPVVDRGHGCDVPGSPTPTPTPTPSPSPTPSGQPSAPPSAAPDPTAGSVPTPQAAP